MYNIGDRIYYYTWSCGYPTGHVASSIITNIEKRHGVIDVKGTESDYFLYETTAGGYIESYNCLSVDNPDVIEYLEKNGGLKNLNIKEEIAKLLFDKGYISTPDDILVKSFLINVYDIDEAE